MLKGHFWDVSETLKLYHNEVPQTDLSDKKIVLEVGIGLS